MTQVETYKTPEQQTANFLFQQAKVLANTEIVPSHLRGKPDHIYAIILTGHEIGIAPSTALQSFASINGKLTMSAELMRALILGAGHSLSFPESSTTTCTIIGKRKETGDTASVTYTKEDAERAGLWTSHTWKKYPRQLLSARATTELARLLFPDIIKGVSYTPEELGNSWTEEEDKPKFEVEGAAINDEPIEAEWNPLEEEHAIDVEVPADDYIVDEPVLKMSDAQRRKAFAIFGKLPEDLKAKAEEGRKTLFGDKSRNDYTRDEANTWIDYLTGLQEGKETSNG